MTIKTTLLSVAAASLILASTTVAFASEDHITYRMSVMKSVGGHMKAMSTILKTDAGDIKDLPVHANAMASLAKIATTVFPENSGQMDGKTKAKMAIWDKPEDFKKVSMAFIAEAEKLASIAGSGDKAAIGAQLGALGKNACKACHDAYKEK